MVALLVALTFIAALLIDAAVRRGRKVEESVELPSFVRPAVAPAAAAMSASAAKPTPKAKSVTNVLVVDDEKTVCNSCRKILAQEGYKVDVALSGEEALNKVKGSGFDVLITDWKMPELDGIEVARKIKKENPNIEVIMITGYPSVESSIKAMRSGVSDYVPKPFTPEELSDAVMRALAKGHAVPADLVRDRLVEKEGGEHRAHA
jgi:DNA-binding NtrC family response regulator